MIRWLMCKLGRHRWVFGVPRYTEWSVSHEVQPGLYGRARYMRTVAVCANCAKEVA